MPRRPQLVHLPVGGPLMAQLPPAQRDRLEEEIRALWGRLQSEESRRGYRGDWARFCAWLAESEKIGPLAVRAVHVQRYLTHLEGRARATRARALAVLRETFAAFVRVDLIEVNPAREAKNPRVQNEPRTPWLTEDELRELLRPDGDPGWFSRRDRVVLLALAGLGLRRSEIARIALDQVRALELEVTDAKGGKSGVVAIPAWLGEVIGEWVELGVLVKGGPLFPSAPGSLAAISASTVYAVVKAAGRRAGLPAHRVTPHAIRRSFVTITGRRGASLKARQLAVLHSSTTTTERYDKAAEAASEAPGDLLQDLTGTPSLTPLTPPKRPQ